MNEDLLENFKQFLLQNLPQVDSFHPHFNDALARMLRAGGKHFRAMLILGVVQNLSPQNLQSAMRVALAYELMHTYSLIHDDLPVMDNAPLRRGQPTLHVVYDEVTAVLVGDALNTHAFFEIANARLEPEIAIKCVEILSKNAGIYGMVLGQALDCHFEKQKLNLENLKFLHIHKTAKLIAAALQTGCVVSGLNANQSDEIYQIGLKLGLAFQIQDDIIDATADEKEVGKPTHNDGVKNSFTNLLGNEGAIASKNKLIEEIKANLNSVDNGVSDIVLNLINKHLK
ncbi:MAG: polyprenyl synthetase family protein [Campylobacter sp.]